MAKLASQNVVIQLSKAVSDDDPETLEVLNDETITSIKEIVSELIEDKSIVIEIVTE